MGSSLPKVKSMSPQKKERSSFFPGVRHKQGGNPMRKDEERRESIFDQALNLLLSWQEQRKDDHFDERFSRRSDRESLASLGEACDERLARMRSHNYKAPKCSSLGEPEDDLSPSKDSEEEEKLKQDNSKYALELSGERQEALIQDGTPRGEPDDITSKQDPKFNRRTTLK